MQDGIHFAGDKNVIRYIAFVKRKLLVIRKVRDIVRTARDEIIHADDFVPVCQQVIAEM